MGLEAFKDREPLAFDAEFKLKKTLTQDVVSQRGEVSKEKPAPLQKQYVGPWVCRVQIEKDFNARMDQASSKTIWNDKTMYMCGGFIKKHKLLCWSASAEFATNFKLHRPSRIQQKRRVETKGRWKHAPAKSRSDGAVGGAREIFTTSGFGVACVVCWLKNKNAQGKFKPIKSRTIPLNITKYSGSPSSTFFTMTTSLESF